MPTAVETVVAGLIGNAIGIVILVVIKGGF